MIKSISISKVATYGNDFAVLSPLNKINFIYGANGSGKTTISRIVANPDSYKGCMLTWNAGHEMLTLVYNRDFVSQNFNESAEIKGIFTLGKKDKELEEKIASAQREINQITNEITNLKRTLSGEEGNGGKQAELAHLESHIKAKCWDQKQKHDKKYSGAFKGFRHSQESFKMKILDEFAYNRSHLCAHDELEKRAETVFGSSPSKEVMLELPSFVKLSAYESDAILTRRVIGKEDVDISAMIVRLENSDWVQKGRSYYEANNGYCPFCQQETSDSLAKSLSDFFDETFSSGIKHIEDIIKGYQDEVERITTHLNKVIVTSLRFLNLEKLKLEKEVFEAKAKINIQRLLEKRQEPSKPIELEPVLVFEQTIGGLMEEANNKAVEHNRMVDNLESERDDLTKEVWKLVSNEISYELKSYLTARADLEKAIINLNGLLSKKMSDRESKAREIKELEKDSSSIQPTIDAINSLLLSYGFKSFSIAKAEKGNFYKLTRADGSEAKETLSEGERTFITFLYFYHLLKGSDSEIGLTTDRVVVFDDPISSLDSDVLFLVSHLIKRVFEETRSGVGNVKQCFVLTHNVYFHKEITFNPSRKNRGSSLKDETFWIVRKTDACSKIEECKSNPITTSYDLLWEELRRDDKNILTIQNTLRRILENYFKIMGDVDPDNICERFEGHDRLICKSLFSWINDGSHFANDDFYVAIDVESVSKYLKVFKDIFEKTNHLAHYKMMMRETDIYPSEEAATV